MVNIAFTAPFLKPKIGGVGVYIKLLVKYLDKRKFNIYDIKSFYESPKRRSKTENVFAKINLIIYLLKFPYILKKHNIDVVHCNPSMRFYPLVREGFFIIISVLLKRKILVFFHGWNDNHANFFKDNTLFKFLFLKVYNSVDVIIVLSNTFKIFLEDMGIKKEIIVEQTMIDDNLLSGFYVNLNNKRKLQDSKFSILFLSRIEKTKGIFETIQAFQILIEKGYRLILHIAGEGSSLEDAKKYVSEKNLININFLGYIQGDEKIHILRNSDFFLFPTYYGEGLPISVLEAICCGLPVITRPVGGIKDFFVNEINGFITKSKSPHIFALLIEKLILDNKLRNKIAKHNYAYGKSRFLASVATKRIEKIYSDLLKG